MEQLVDPRALWRAMVAGEARYVDVRTAAEHAGGVPPGAALLPMHRIDARGRRALLPDFAERALALRATTPPEVTLVLACRTGARSHQAALLLDALGSPGWAHFRGGWEGQIDAWGRTAAEGWREAGLPIAAPGVPVAEHDRRSGPDPAPTDPSGV